MNGKKTYTIRWKISLILLIGVLVCFLGSILGCTMKREAPAYQAKGGVLDIRDHSFDKGGTVPLDGEWRFEWFGAKAGEKAEGFIPVPGTWGATALKDGTRLSDHGRGIYRLTILHRATDGYLAVRLPNLSTAYNLYVNGDLQLSRGVVGGERKLTTPYQLPAIAYLDGQEEKTELTLEVANYHHRTGGIRTGLVMGTLSQIHALRFNLQSQELVVFGALLIIGVYHLGLFVLRRQEWSNLFLALLCIGVACRMGVIGEGMFPHWIPSLTWTFEMRIEYMAFALSTLFGFAYYQRMYSQEISVRWLKLGAAVGIVLALGCLTLPVLQFSRFLAAYQIYVIGLSAVTLFGLALALIRRREGARLAILGAGGLVLTIVNDIFFYNGWMESVNLVSFGLLFLILMNAFAISLRTSRTHDRAEQMSVELTEWNHYLEDRIAKRTEELQNSYEELAESKLGLERMEQSRRQLISNISHDLRTPITLLQGYLEALRDGIIADPQQKDKTLKLMLTKVEGLNGMIQDLFDLSMLESRRIRMNFELAAIRDWRERLRLEYEQELQEKGIAFGCIGPNEEEALETVLVDEHRMDRVFANLIYNAVRHTPRGGSITLRFAVDSKSRQVRIDVIDTGTGILESDLPFIFERFYKNSKSRHSSSGGSGLGLSIAREIVEMHQGSLFAENGTNGGSVFTITLPLFSEEDRKTISS
ncbi:cell wall metabolism sensor histidine kinase WalK [Cohnella sp. AR92]|uniref:sensor histidine kinase n=1 Tax=Cohnella sp. AR92 TaxID=648716 RepID=UPI0013154B90|nr:sensor histidine kinase [Cohnella sp. AR92]